MATETTLGRMEAALQRLLDGKPTRVKKVGRLSLNRINQEAGCGHSYINKPQFKEFRETRALPAIEEFNKSYDPERLALAFDEGKKDLTEVEVLKAKLKKERELKEKYRNERDDALAASKELEALNSTLMFRVYELQGQVRTNNVVSLSK
ncbi:hypothetical protein GBO14_09040 [Pseudoalteromonas shioyasakiensis]|uniref:hypothetical protein n=1 Tax=Pseudoalteromonas shioyasakiensis TaxID=1190813 RepID=UPI0020960625|nr:hypothetical protein [Pseudoalteromonas shioyasakiensis]MCO6354861.1 hypothetical protein [Pseudoalteromonas shioyasakiensis]